MNRRTFLQALGGVVTAGVAAAFLPIPAPPHAIGSLGLPPTVDGLASYPKAFELVMEPLGNNVAFTWDHLEAPWSRKAAR